MLKQENGGGDGSAGCNNWPRICDTCRVSACTVYCRADSAYLCAGCDARVHAANQVASRHERVWVCEACERAPAAFLCKADAASLCAACDADIHSANPLASRHHRVPIPPISGYGAPAGEEGFLTRGGEEEEEFMDEEDEEEAASWLLLNPMKNNNNLNNGFLFNGEVDEYLDLMDGGHSQFTDQYGQNQQQQQYGVVSHKSYGGDSVVPVQCGEGKTHQLQQQQQQAQHFQLGLDFEPSKAAYSYSASISQSVRGS
ncbi:hypothetical protein L6164_007635 [Bauhinia variegata]|uniref:Uncharacterized protein n=1 Tax=Bauhinia variegata TaxID=167791 RepID=A0ACB9PEC3_BAUVA|nr:hypothetical protein L6164_007635 [Bauhinia variegata]